ncbi:hypothetical protein ANO11243_050580 [Dothideomycetidae sp. 11243]|nr:hypothetical protein ANO11243_050580 [fungal sp. No.11243]
MADEEFDIDIWGDDKPEDVEEPPLEPKKALPDAVPKDSPEDQRDKAESGTESRHTESTSRSGGANSTTSTLRAQSSQPQITVGDSGPASNGETLDHDHQMDDGGEDHRPVDSDATCALKLMEMQWWTTEDDVRGWINQSGVEGELREITFNEHKINGKSKGEAFVEFVSPQAATATKNQMQELFGDQPAAKRVAVSFVPAETNPYKSHVKDAASRTRDTGNNRQQGAYTSNNYNNTQSGYRAGRGGFNRGGFHNQNRGGFNNHNSMGMGSGYNNNMGSMGNMGGMGNYGNMGYNRGGGNMMGMGMGMNHGGYGGNRGGRGGMMGGNMGMMPNMGMGGMNGMGMGMDMGMGGMGFGGFAQGQYNQHQQFGAGGATNNMSNPHGAKRPRPE